MRILTDGTGRRFDPETSEKFNEDHVWDGHNRSSVATGTSYAHEAIYRTAGGRWIRHFWSAWEGQLDRWEEITATDAARWLSTNGHDSHPACEKEFAALEIA